VDESTSASDELGRLFLRCGLIALLLWAPLPFGSARPMAVVAIQLHAVLLGVLSCWILLKIPFAFPRSLVLLTCCAGLVLALGACQLVPLPASWSAAVAPRATELRSSIQPFLGEGMVGWAPISVSPVLTLNAVLRFGAYAVIALATFLALRRPGELRLFCAVIAAAGALQATYGTVEYLSGHQHIFGYEKEYFFDEASGTFINRNHFAVYLAMSLPFAIGLVLVGIRKFTPGNSLRNTLLSLATPAGLSVAGGSVAAALIWTGVLLSYSRSGLVASIAGIGFLFARSGSRKRALAILLVLLLPTLFLLWQEVRAPAERFLDGDSVVPELGDRLTVWLASAQMIPDFFPLGTGMGTFGEAFPLYRPPSIQRFWLHAHNEWLQFGIEGGGTLLAVAIVIFLVSIRSASRPSLDPVLSVVRVASGSAILAVAVHSLTDFGLRIPAIAVLTATMIGVAMIPTPRDLRRPPGRHLQPVAPIPSSRG